MRKARRRARDVRRGATLVEFAVVLPVFMLLVIGMIVLGMAVLRYSSLAHAAREGARQAAVHGELADRLGPWGPEPAEGTLDTASDFHPIAPFLRRTLLEPDLSAVTATVEWPDGTNAFGDPVRVTLSAPFRPMTSILSGFPITLKAESTMSIAH